jgi:dTDP-4-amino-4,6-dideoxygalactose transaminase
MQPARQIADLLGMRDGLPFARGSAALYALLKTLARYHGAGEVIVPALCCEAVALAAIYAGHQVRFADVSKETLCVTPETVMPLLTERTRAVIVAHLYGIDADVDRFNALRQSFPQVAFVEDLAHAIGGRRRDGRLLGGGMDYTLLSFAESKILPGDGGVLLFGADTLDTAEVAAAIPETAPRMPQPRLAVSLRNLVHGLADLSWIQPSAKIDSAFATVQNNYRDLIVCSGGIADESSIRNSLPKLEDIRSARYRNYVIYKNGISTKYARVIELHEGSTCWRCPVLFDEPGSAQRATKELRNAGIHASNHYFPLNLLFGGGRVPVSEAVSARILNLWTDDRTSLPMIECAINLINCH